MSEGNILKGHAVKQTAEKMEKKTFRLTRTWPLGRHSCQAPVIRIQGSGKILNLNVCICCTMGALLKVIPFDHGNYIWNRLRDLA